MLKSIVENSHCIGFISMNRQKYFQQVYLQNYKRKHPNFSIFPKLIITGSFPPSILVKN